TVLGIVFIATVANAQIVINEVYGGGGNSGATYKNDFVELINKGTASVTLTGATLQYASAAGTFNQYHPLPNITLAPGQKYLIQE
ncbi:MAG: lamin tail domain-containing protein, partial [Weeksellaceae bacterium]|nr:lamin tail domain-containing protein [Weeksellaceae bacterium]